MWTSCLPDLHILIFSTGKMDTSFTWYPNVQQAYPSRYFPHTLVTFYHSHQSLLDNLWDEDTVANAHLSLVKEVRKNCLEEGRNRSREKESQQKAERSELRKAWADREWPEDRIPAVSTKWCISSTTEKPHGGETNIYTSQTVTQTTFDSVNKATRRSPACALLGVGNVMPQSNGSSRTVVNAPSD